MIHDIQFFLTNDMTYYINDIECCLVIIECLPVFFQSLNPKKRIEDLFKA